jgi:hypothetical protein
MINNDSFRRRYQTICDVPLSQGKNYEDKNAAAYWPFNHARESTHPKGTTKTTNKDIWRRKRVRKGENFSRQNPTSQRRKTAHTQKPPAHCDQSGMESIPRRVTEIKRKQRPKHPVARAVTNQHPDAGRKNTRNRNPPLHCVQDRDAIDGRKPHQNRTQERAETEKHMTATTASPPAPVLAMAPPPHPQSKQNRDQNLPQPTSKPWEATARQLWRAGSIKHRRNQ